MCGIIGVKGPRSLPLVAKGLVILEYRGYDSFGVGAKVGETFRLFKEADPSGKRGPWAILGGSASSLEEALERAEAWAKAWEGEIGTPSLALGHTRWATHGDVRRENAHPHVVGSTMVVHNGTTNNYSQLRSMLGRPLYSQTDTEVIAALIEENYSKGMEPLRAIQDALAKVEGHYALLIVFKDRDEIFLAKRGQPLVVHESLSAIASDAEAFAPLGSRYSMVEDGAIAALSQLSGPFPHPVPTLEQVGKGGYAHFMRKEIEEQRELFKNAFAVDVERAKALLEESPWILVTGAGTSYNAGLLFHHYWREKNSREGRRQMVEVEYAHEAYQPLPEGAVLLAISQSGETSDVVEAMGRLSGNIRKVAVLNRVASTIAALSDVVVPIMAYTEVGVAATKSYTNQLIVLLRMADVDLRVEAIEEAIGEALALEEAIASLAETLKDSPNQFTFLGKGASRHIAKEIELKVQEVARQKSKPLPLGEVKHGPIALAGNGSTYIVFMPLPSDRAGEAMWKDAEGELVKLLSRGAPVVAFTPRHLSVEGENLYTIHLPDVGIETLFAYVVAGQLLAYHLAVLRKLNPDRPTNLAKSVTVR